MPIQNQRLNLSKPNATQRAAQLDMSALERGGAALGAGVGQLIENKQAQEAAQAKAAEMAFHNDVSTFNSSLLQNDPSTWDEAIFKRGQDYLASGDEANYQSMQEMLFMTPEQKRQEITKDFSLAERAAGRDPSKFLQGVAGGGASKFGRLAPALDENNNPVYIQSSGAGDIRVAEGFRPITTADKESDKTKELLNREKVLKGKRQQIEKEEIDLLQKKAEFDMTQAKVDVQEQAAGDLFGLGEQLLNGDLESIYGKGESLYPDLARSQKGIDLIASRNRFVASLELAAAGKMKGQGTLSDGERKILKDGATTLSNPDISADAARAEINRILPTYAKASGIDVSGGGQPQVKFLGFE